MAQNDKPAVRTSRIGKRPLVLPKGVTATVTGTRVEVKGPKGALARAFPANVAVTLDAAALHVTSTAPGRDGARLQGMARALLGNMVQGVTQGYERVLELHGTGYRCELKGKSLHFALGYSHPVVFDIPTGISAAVPAESKGTVLILQGNDKAVLGQTAATIRGFREPEPYGGKGVRYRGERVREKAGKTGK
jgi:large subunit ribosomal protein L6